MRKLKVAAVQMDATPAPVLDRLARAADLISEAVSSGAQLIVLPELFNTGYEYTDNNYRLPEPMDGQTVTWMKEQTAKHNIHLAGSLLLLDHDEVYNSQLIVAPDGRAWRYDKNYPWGWERAFFREGKGITVADTDIGKFGMMICWDYAHINLWKRYTGKVDAMIITSCPPKMDKFETTLPDGSTIPPVFADPNPAPFGDDMNEFTNWLNVPLVNTTSSGQFESTLPIPLISVGSIIAMSGQNDKWTNLINADQAKVTAGYYNETKIVDSNGKVLTRINEDGDRFTIAEVEIADEPPNPRMGNPPKSKFGKPAYFFSDMLIPSIMTWAYRRKYRRELGSHMAPVDSTTKVWSIALVYALVLGWFTGRFTRR